MACVDIEREIAQTQSIIDEVNKDKDDISGADVIDGVLWFPFNLIAKSQNYNDALQAADKRIARLNEMKKEKDCANDANAVAQTQNLTNQLSELNRQYKDGSLTEEEYKLAKAKLLRDWSGETARLVKKCLKILLAILWVRVIIHLKQEVYIELLFWPKICLGNILFFLRRYRTFYPGILLLVFR